MPLPDEDALHPQQIEALRCMSYAEKYDLAMKLYWDARAVTAAGVRMRHSDWNEEQVQQEVKRIYLYATT